MFIESLKVRYPESGWELEETKFDQFNLLVGASGVGKTRILEAILDLTRLVMGTRALELVKDSECSEGFEWELSFRLSNSDNTYTWRGSLVEIIDQEKRSIYYNNEELFQGRRNIFYRKGSEIFYDGKELPKLSPSTSLLFLLQEEIEVGEVYDGFLDIIGSGEEGFSDARYNKPIGLDHFKTADDIIDSSEKFIFKLWWAFNRREKLDLFNHLVQNFIEIFPQVESVGMSKSIIPNIKDHGGNITLLHLEVQEKGVKRKLDYHGLSLGMQRTLDFLGQIYLLPENSVILIDEFENSLGVNCINFVADAIVNAKRGLQFIITSHHPYIINNVDFKHWKIVTRKGSVVSARAAKEFGLGKSKHERFFQLTNMEAFRTGQTPELIK